jgi:hypothetical protein
MTKDVYEADGLSETSLIDDTDTDYAGKTLYTDSSVLTTNGSICPEMKVDKITWISRYEVIKYDHIMDGITAEFGGNDWDHQCRPSSGFSFGLQTRFPDAAGNPTKEKAHISIGKAPPNSKSEPHARARIEYNPSRAGSHGVTYLRHRLDKALPGGWEEFLLGADVTRIDHAVDIPCVSIGDILFSSSNQQCSAIYTDRHGDPQTIYIGRRGNKRFLRAYQKGKSNPPFMRIEYETRKVGPLRDIGVNLKNPFANLQLYHFPQPDLPAHLIWFIDCARQRGIRRALNIAPKAERKALAEFLAAAKAAWWQPVEIWKQWGADPAVFIFGKPTLTSSISHSTQELQPAA